MVNLGRIAVRYSRELRKEFGLWPSWLPDSTIRLGDFGHLEDGVFVQDGNLSQLGIDVSRGSSPNHVSDHVFASSGVVSATVAGATGVVDAMHGKTTVKFSRSFGAFVALSGCREVRARWLSDVAQRLLELASSSGWDATSYIVSSILRAEAGVIAISSRRGGLFEIEGGTFMVGMGELNISRESGLQYSNIMRAGCTPLFSLVRLAAKGQAILRGAPDAPQSDLYLIPIDARAGIEDA